LGVAKKVKTSNQCQQDKRVKSLKSLSDGPLGLHYLQKTDLKTGQEKEKDKNDEIAQKNEI
jgi:hypothetical protein